MSVLETLLIKVRGETRDYEMAMKRVKGTTAKAASGMKRLKGELTKTRSSMGLFAGAAGVGFVTKQMFDLGASVEETASKFATVFGESTEEVDRFIDSFGTLAGLSKTQAREVTSTTAAMVQGMGFAREASAQLAIEATKLAGDLSSFNNVPIEETSRAIQAAITGEREQLKRLGIVVRETDVQQKAMAMSGKSNAKALTDQEKAAATMALITERAGVAVGDLARTQDSAANQARQLQAELLNVRETLAVGLMPVFTVVLSGIGKFVKGMMIMGAEAAVLVAKIDLLRARMKFWDEEGITTARQNLEFMQQAAEEVKLEIVGLTSAFDVATGTVGSFAASTASAASALQLENLPLREMGVALPQITANVRLFESAQYALATATNTAADAQDRLNSALGKAQGFLGSLGSLGRVFGATIPGLGAAQGLLGSIPGFAGLFADGGTIPGGQWGIVGERGPEIVQGPAKVTPASEGMTVTVNVGPARDPISLARDQQWLRALRESNLNLAAQGA